jgi:3-hydroxybutyryl-CoA dehydrogenase
MPYTEPLSLAGKPFVILGAGTLGRRIALMWLTQGEIVHLVYTPLFLRLFYRC